MSTSSSASSSSPSPPPAPAAAFSPVLDGDVGGGTAAPEMGLLRLLLRFLASLRLGLFLLRLRLGLLRLLAFFFRPPLPLRLPLLFFDPPLRFLPARWLPLLRLWLPFFLPRPLRLELLLLLRPRLLPRLWAPRLPWLPSRFLQRLLLLLLLLLPLRLTLFFRFPLLLLLLFWLPLRPRLPLPLPLPFLFPRFRKMEGDDRDLDLGGGLASALGAACFCSSRSVGFTST
mmetsp:Transcript_17800/g.55761  ORF Transcript_17800/g.55761 Transcript_17800/m.55761 type:complete len:229 (+) Transcript_17800:736-1422(+)